MLSFPSRPTWLNVFMYHIDVDAVPPSQIPTALQPALAICFVLVLCSYLDDMTPERVDAQGVSNLVAAAQRFLPKPQRSVEEVLSMRSAADLARWQRLDDVIMGGQSASGLEPAADGSGAVWNGGYGQRVGGGMPCLGVAGVPGSRPGSCLPGLSGVSSTGCARHRTAAT